MNTFKKALYNITRPSAMKYLTGNLGKVVEDDEKITCYVKRSKVKKKDYHYTIACFGIGENQEKVAKAYNLNKPICYVIDGLKFKKHQVYIFGYNNCEVIIKNCDFGLGLHIHVNDKCTLDNTNITTFSYLSIGANKLVIKNVDSKQINAISSESNIYFGADNRIEVIDSNIGCQNENINVSFLATNELNIVNSKIIGKEVECKSSTINADEKSSLTAEETSNEKKSVVLKKITEPLSLKRLELVNLLKKVKTQCENINEEKVLEYEEQINVQTVSKVLKK